MKKLLASASICLALMGAAQENKTWRLGAQWGFHNNRSELSGGMETANGRFQHEDFSGAAMTILARYDHNPRWMFQTGLGFNTWGYQFSLSENYSLLNAQNRYSTIKSEFGAIEVPALLHYKFTPNCRNVRWLLGAGIAFNLAGPQTITKSFVENTEGNQGQNYLRSTASSSGGAYTFLRVSVGRERILRSGSMLNLSLLLNAGVNELSRASVVYTADGQEYGHEFVNRGNFIGLRVAYYFRPLNPGSKDQNLR